MPSLSVLALTQGHLYIYYYYFLFFLQDTVLMFDSWILGEMLVVVVVGVLVEEEEEEVIVVVVAEEEVVLDDFWPTSQTQIVVRILILIELLFSFLLFSEELVAVLFWGVQQDSIFPTTEIRMVLQHDVALVLDAGSSSSSFQTLFYILIRRSIPVFLSHRMSFYIVLFVYIAGRLQIY